MTDYTFSYRLQSAPSARTDGSGDIDHDIWAMVSRDSGDKTPELHKTVSVPSSDVKTVMDMPDGTSQEKQAKNTAYKNLLKTYRDRIPMPISGWSDAQLLERVENNDFSSEQATRVNTYITVTLGQSYPVDFNL